MNTTTQTVEERIEALEKENKELKRQLLKSSLPDANDVSWSQNIIDSLPNPLFIKNEKHQYVSFNKAFRELLQHTEEELLGKTDYDFFSKEQSDIFWRMDSEVLANGNINWNEEDLTVDGNKLKILTSKTRIRDGQSKPYVLGVITDITENKNQQILLKKKNSEIEAQKKHVQTLLKEIHHRVKNNMQIVSSLLNMQMAQFEDEKVLKAFNNCKNRILAMAKVHEILYQTNNFADINFETYLQDLIDTIKDSYKLGDDIKFDTDVISLYMHIEKAVPLGLILNEIITNAIKHGASDNQPLNIKTKLVCDEKVCTLEVGDDGVGMKADALKNSKGLGAELIQLLSEQLDAEIELVKDTKGVHYKLVYPAK